MLRELLNVVRVTCYLQCCLCYVSYLQCCLCYVSYAVLFVLRELFIVSVLRKLFSVVRVP